MAILRTLTFSCRKTFFHECCAEVCSQGHALVKHILASTKKISQRTSVIFLEEELPAIIKIAYSYELRTHH